MFGPRYMFLLSYFYKTDSNMNAMNRATFSIVILALLGDFCMAEIVHNTVETKHLGRLYQAAVDISMTCYGDPGNAVGVVGDTDGSIIKEFRLNHMIPVVLVEGRDHRIRDSNLRARAHKLQVFVIAVNSPKQLNELLFEIRNSIWWNTDASFLLVDTRPALRDQCLSPEHFMITTFRNGILNAQMICHTDGKGSKMIVIVNTNPFINRAPKAWDFLMEYDLQSRDDRRTGFLFIRLYREGGESCESINFEKTRNVGGYPIRFITDGHTSVYRRDRVFSQLFEESSRSYQNIITQYSYTEHRLLMDTIGITMNVTEVITNDTTRGGIVLSPYLLSNNPEIYEATSFGIIVRMTEEPIFAVTQHTPHMSQLEKVLTVIDRKSRIGMCLVYLISFLFFKFFLRQAVIPALLNLVRLTCNTGLTRLPQNVAPTLYLTSLFMFVVTLQAIYTGNLATLLTTTIPYPNVQTKEDIPRRGYTLYIGKNRYTKLIADPILDGCFAEIPRSDKCIENVLHDPLAVCAMDYQEAIIAAAKWKLHVSKYPIVHEYPVNFISEPNMFKRRIDEVMMTTFEAGLRRSTAVIEKIRLKLVDDDEVKKNMDRRVMTLDDLSFAFVILGVGLLCSLICFVGEIVIWKIQLKYAKRRDRVRVRSAWGATTKNVLRFRR